MDVVDCFAPIVHARMMRNEHEQDRIFKLAELCNKYGVSYMAVINIIGELGKWEEENAES